MEGSTSFWLYQLKAAWRNLESTSRLKRVAPFLEFSRRLLSRHHSASGSPKVGCDIPEDERLTVIVLNHRRPHNVGKIAQYVLRAGYVGRLIISNNSQAYPIENFVKVTDPRLILLNQKEPSGVGISMELAREYRSRYYLRIDDDIFLHPAQMQWIYWNLLRKPDRPHGIFGAVFSPEQNPDRKWPFVHRRNTTASVEILNGLFAFNRDHLDEYFRLCNYLGITDQKSLMNGEDIVLSFSGSHKPLVHNVGPIWECATEATSGLALHQTRPRFYEERLEIYSRLERMKQLADGI